MNRKMFVPIMGLALLCLCLCFTATSVRADAIAVRISAWNPAQDTIPHILSTSPTRNELNVPVSTNISVTFDIDMDETTINDSSFVVNGWLTGLHQGTINYDTQTKTATLDPSSDFDVGELVTVALTTGIKSSQGVSLQMDTGYVFSFTVRALDGNAIFSSGSIQPVGRKLQERDL